MKNHEQFCPIYNGRECDCNYREPVASAGNALSERDAFETWYCEDAARQGYPMPDGIKDLRDGDHYGVHRSMLNGKWQGWRAGRAALASQSTPVAPVVEQARDGFKAWMAANKRWISLAEYPSGKFIHTPTELMAEAWTAALAQSTPHVPAGEGLVISLARELLDSELAELACTGSDAPVEDTLGRLQDALSGHSAFAAVKPAAERNLALYRKVMDTRRTQSAKSTLSNGELSAIAMQAAWRSSTDGNAPSYLPRSTIEAATWKPHDWVLLAMRDAIRAALAQSTPHVPAGEPDASEPVRVARLTLNGETLVMLAADLGTYDDDERDEHVYTLAFATMTRAEFEALGEFDGF